ncbi:hypothetical protein CPB84DRAFT_1788267 [Gymnopilus junonius]|uniref:Uncharacterized protein n=1 Tax=Gymnopilus junonius TaxID=109634 RepID=A0A9P5TIP7_GYMJU|nr:hypothetical protein CPB84DRAFT_1788267 [Gymnopilus junonius]
MAFPFVAFAMITVDSSSDPALGLINATYFSANNFTGALLTKLGGGAGASFPRWPTSDLLRLSVRCSVPSLDTRCASHYAVGSYHASQVSAT